MREGSEDPAPDAGFEEGVLTRSLAGSTTPARFLHPPGIRSPHRPLLAIRNGALAAVLASARLAGPLEAQQNQEKRPGDVTATVEVTILNLDVLVVDRKEKPVFDLKATELEVKVAGRVQPIEFFEPPAPPTPAGEPPARLAGTTVPLEGLTRLRNHLLFYLDREGLSRDGLTHAVKAIDGSLDRLEGGVRVSVIAHFGSAARLAWEEVSLDRVRSELERLVDLLPSEERSASVAGTERATQASGTFAEPIRSWENRRRREAQLVDACLKAEEDYAITRSAATLRIANQEIADYVRLESLRARQALEELRIVCELYAQLEGRRQVVLVSEGFERNPGANFLQFLASARATKRSGGMGAGSSATSQPSAMSRFLAGQMPGLDAFEDWLGASGVSLHFVNPVQRVEGGSVEYAGAEMVRNSRAETLALEDGAARLTEKTGGLVAGVVAGLVPLVETTRSMYRVGVRLTGVEPGKPYKVVVTSKRKGVTVRHQSSFQKPTEAAKPAASEVAQAERAMAEARRDEKREGTGAIRLTGLPIPLKIEWKGKVRPDPKRPGRNLYRAEIVVPYDDLRFVAAGDGLIANVRLSITAVGIKGTSGEDESTMDEAPSFTGEEYRAAQGKSLTRAMLLSLPAGAYRLSAAASDQVEARSGMAQLEVVAAP